MKTIAISLMVSTMALTIVYTFAKSVDMQTKHYQQILNKR